MNYIDWAKENFHRELISLGRSGRDWLGDLLEKITEEKIAKLPSYSSQTNESFIFENKYEKYLLIAHHGNQAVETKNGQYILLFRDPRDAILSGAYYALANPAIFHRKEKTIVELLEKAESFWRDKLYRWKWIYETYSEKDSLIVQYERLCFFPELELGEVLRFLGCSEKRKIMEVVKEEDSQKLHPKRGNEYLPVIFENGLKRYRNHCLKWQRDPFFLEKYNDRIYSSLGPIMEKFGYTKFGHDHKLLFLKSENLVNNSS